MTAFHESATRVDVDFGACRAAPLRQPAVLAAHQRAGDAVAARARVHAAEPAVVARLGHRVAELEADQPAAVARQHRGGVGPRQMFDQLAFS